MQEMYRTERRVNLFMFHVQGKSSYLYRRKKVRKYAGKQKSERIVTRYLNNKTKLRATTKKRTKPSSNKISDVPVTESFVTAHVVGYKGCKRLLTRF